MVRLLFILLGEIRRIKRRREKRCCLWEVVRGEMDEGFELRCCEVRFEIIKEFGKGQLGVERWLDGWMRVQGGVSMNMIPIVCLATSLVDTSVVFF